MVTTNLINNDQYKLVNEFPSPPVIREITRRIILRSTTAIRLGDNCVSVAQATPEDGHCVQTCQLTPPGANSPASQSLAGHTRSGDEPSTRARRQIGRMREPDLNK